ncbi:MAG: AraC family transcriptional regulator [Spirochaetota bacterium]
MTSKLEYLIARITAAGTCAVGITDLANIVQIPSLATSHTTHCGVRCMKVKEDQDNLRICRAYKQRKIERAVKGKEPFFDICPFGLYDHVNPVGRDMPLAVVFVTFMGGTLTRRVRSVSEFDPAAPSAFPEKSAMSAFSDEAVHAAAVIADVIERNAPSYALAKAQHTMRSKAYIARAIIAEYFRSPITLTTLSGNIGIDKSVLARTFKRSFGHTIHDEIALCRIAHARGLIERGVSITDAAFDSGFSDASYFCKLFRKHTGIAPKDWRKSHG